MSTKEKLTVKNYFQNYERLQILKRYPKGKQFHEFFAKATDDGKNWENYKNEEHTRSVIDQYIEILNEYLSEGDGGKKAAESSQKTPVKKQVKPTPEKKAPPKQSAVRKANAAKKKKVEKASPKILRLPKGKMVEMIDPHLLVIARYMRMNGKVRTHRALENFFSQINKAAESKILRKASAYADMVIYIQKSLLGYLEREKDEYKIDIPTAKYESMQKAVAKEQQMASVKLLKRYHGMSGRATTIDKAKRLYNEMYRAIEAGNIPSSDRLYKRVVKVMKDLLAFVEKADESDLLDRLPAELAGVLGFMDGCLCQQDRELNGVGSPEEVEFSFFGEGEAELNGPVFPDPKTPVPSTELRNFHFERLQIEEPWVWLFGELTEGSTTMVKGDEKMGKSILMICFARYLAENFGKVLYITSEEGWSATTQNKFDETDTYHPDLEIVAEMPDDIDKFKFVIYDSVSKMKISPEEFFNLKKLYPKKCFFGIFHLTHGGQQRGSREFSYDVDNIVSVIDDGIAVARGRLLGTSRGEVNFFDFCLND